jgi:hypothetical protein
VAAAASVSFAAVRWTEVRTAVVVVARAVVKRCAALAAAATVPHVVVHPVAEARRIAVALQIVVVLWVIVRRDARWVLQFGTRTRDVEGRVRARGLAGHDPWVLFDVGLWGAANEGSGTEGGPPSTDSLHPKVGVGIRRLNWAMIPNAKNLMSRLKVTLNSHRVIPMDVVRDARKGSGFRRLFRERALRLVARLRNGFAPAVSLSTVNPRCSAYASGRLIMCGLTVA